MEGSFGRHTANVGTYRVPHWARYRLYEANVPVAGQDEQARAAAVDVGFRDVLVKVAGPARVLATPADAAPRSRAHTYLTQF